MTDEWGVAHQARGKQIWVRIPTPPTWAYSESCACHDEDRAQRTASGHRVVDMLA